MRFARKFTDAEEREIAKLYEIGGFSVPAIMRAYGLSDSKVIYSALDRQGVERRARKFFSKTEEQEIAKLYEVGGYSTPQIAHAYRCHRSSIYRALKQQGVEGHTRRRFTDEEELEIVKIYGVGGFPARQIACAYGCAHSMIYRALDRQGAEMRDPNSSRLKLNDEEALEIGKIYDVGLRTTTELAEAYGVNHVTICNTLERVGISRRTRSETLRGERNGRWEGGKSFELYPEEFWEKREAIRERDGRVCQICGAHESQLDRRLDVHHIDGDKQNNDDHNLISLCRECHGKAEKGEDREYYAAFLQSHQSLRLSGELLRAVQ